VLQEGLGWSEKVTLYHHYDGYPSGIIPLLEKAYKRFSRPRRCCWELGRVGKVASFLCATDPGGFEPEDNHDLHFDIEYFYRLYLVNTAHGTTAERPRWEVEIYTSHGLSLDFEAHKMSAQNMIKILERKPLAEIAGLTHEEWDALEEKAMPRQKKRERAVA
jgi:hypothetical protein